MTSKAIWDKITRGVFIVAEAGKNFIQTEADQPVAVYLENANKLAKIAKEAGADGIKFQTHTVEDEILNIKFVSPHFPNWKSGDRYGWISRNTQATPVNEFWRPLKKYCEDIGIVFFSTPMSRGAAKRLQEADTPIWKVGSGDILDFPLLEYIVSTGKPIIISSGMSTIEEIDMSVNFLKKRRAKFALMHCLSKYPGLPEEANLGTIDLYRERYPGVPIGFSENSIGIEPSLVAVAQGATFVEKHFSLSRDIWGPDHKVSSTPEELKTMIAQIRKIETNPKEREKWFNHPNFKAIYGVKEKTLQKGEEVFRPLFRKSLMAGCDIPADTVITADMVYAMRPQALAGGLPSEKYEEVIGKKSKNALKKFDPIGTSNLI